LGDEVLPEDPGIAHEAQKRRDMANAGVSATANLGLPTCTVFEVVLDAQTALEAGHMDASAQQGSFLAKITWAVRGLVPRVFVGPILLGKLCLRLWAAARSLLLS
jgi:hypothetical protein